MSGLVEVRAACGCLAIVMVNDAENWADCGKDIAKAAARFGPPVIVPEGVKSAPWKCPQHPNAGIREVTGKWKPPKPEPAETTEMGL